jgi:hypothetical protein
LCENIIAIRQSSYKFVSNIRNNHFYKKFLKI